MKIVIYSPTFFPPIIDGTSVQAARQVNILSAQHEVYGITYSIDREIREVSPREYSDKVERIRPDYLKNSEGRFRQLSGNRVIKRIKEIKPEVIGIRGWYQLNVVDRIVDNFATRSRIYWHVDGLHECHEMFRNTSHYKSLIEKAIKLRVEFVVNSDKDVEILQSMEIDNGQIHRLSPILRVTKHVKKDWKTPNLLTVGRFFPYKNHNLVYEWVNEVDKNIELNLVGVADGLESELLVQNLARKGARLVINPSEELVNKLFSRTTHFLLASEVESLGVATLEAVCSGAIPLVRRIGGISSYLPRRFLFDNRLDFQAKLKHLLDPKKASDESKNLETLRHNLSVEKVSKTLIDMYTGD